MGSLGTEVDDIPKTCLSTFDNFRHFLDLFSYQVNGKYSMTILPSPLYRSNSSQTVFTESVARFFRFHQGRSAHE